MSKFCLKLDRLDAEQRVDLMRATYFTLECYTQFGDHNLLASIQDAEDQGGFTVNIGLPDRPAHRHVLKFDTFEEGLDALTAFKVGFPEAGLWLSCMEVEEEIRGPDVWRGAVAVMAALDLDDDDCPWENLAKAIAQADAAGRPVIFDTSDVHEVIEGVVARL